MFCCEENDSWFAERASELIGVLLWMCDSGHDCEQTRETHIYMHISEYMLFQMFQSGCGMGLVQ